MPLTRPRILPTALLAAALALAACGRTPDRTDTADAAVERQPIPAGVAPRMVEWRADGVLIPSADSLRSLPGYVVDSIFPPDEALRRFQATVQGAAPTGLTGGAADSVTLLKRYWTALLAKDTLAIRLLVVSHAEFAYLFFPESVAFASGMQPSAAWILYESSTGRGLTRAFGAAQGVDATTAQNVSTICRDRQSEEGRSLVYGPCGVVLRRGTQRDTLWIASTLIRRDGVHKFLGLDSPL